MKKPGQLSAGEILKKCEMPTAAIMLRGVAAA
jgi:hypothetical protein